MKSLEEEKQVCSTRNTFQLKLSGVGEFLDLVYKKLVGAQVWAV